MEIKFRQLTIAALSATAALLASAASSAQDRTGDRLYAGRASVYRQLDDSSLEAVTTPERLKAVTLGNVAPTEIWRALEHGEKVECLDCIPYVADLLYDSHDKTREIAAWWLRRRIFGVFGPGEVYSQVVDTLNNDESDIRRAYAANALGEFLTQAGVPHVARAAVEDASPRVRKSAVLALRRLNTQGPNFELAQAMRDPSEAVRLAALHSAVRVNVFTEVGAVLELVGDSSPAVRRRAAETLGVMRVGDAVTGLMALADPDTEDNARVRVAAIAALGRIGDSVARDVVEAAFADPDPLVQSTARIAARRL